MEWAKIIYKEIRYPILRLCHKFKITANQITVLNHLLTLTVGCYFFSRGTYIGGMLGLSIMLINGFLDYLDGDVAKMNNNISKLGEWLDTGFDVVIQNAVMGAISIGCYKQGLPLIWVILFFVSNAGNNLVSFNYNAVFGFHSANGNELFRQFMDNKPTLINRFLKNAIDPTASFTGLLFFTLRYWIAAGILFNIMPACFILMTIIGNAKWSLMFTLFALHQAQYKKLYVSQALSVLDDERREFYALRGGS
jgi:phosphatidylglycerophosphate synthase